MLCTETAPAVQSPAGAVFVSSLVSQANNDNIDEAVVNGKSGRRSCLQSDWR